MNEFDRAMDRVRDEMAKSSNDAIGGVGAMVTEMLRQRPEWAARIGAGDKSLRGLYDKMYEIAKKNKKGNCYYMSPLEAVQIACEYYGIDGELPDVYGAAMAGSEPPRAPEGGAHAPAPAPAPADDLDALLAGL